MVLSLVKVTLSQVQLYTVEMGYLKVLRNPICMDRERYLAGGQPQPHVQYFTKSLVFNSLGA